MAITYNIEAEVIDISRDEPQPDDAFLVDTNVWFWMHYQRASRSDQAPRPYQSGSYPRYVGKVLRARAQLYRCDLSLSELAHLIEKTEWQIYCSTHPDLRLNAKEYRHNLPEERAGVVDEIADVWSLVRRMAQPLDVTVGETLSDAAMARMMVQPIAGYDVFLIEAAINSQILQILTDDGDFASVPGIRVFTANKNVIEAADREGKLIVR